jgi:rubrerythrin
MGGKLSRQPDADISDLSELAGVAHAIEIEAMRRYELLAGEMDRLGETAVAATFRDLVAEEERHVEDIRQWAGRENLTLPDADDYAWRLPEDIATSWDEVAGSALLTPYRALAVAVTNEERAFAFYAYIAAQAPRPEIAAAAEQLAREELRHAVVLRQMRRHAYHRERGGKPPSHPEEVGNIAQFEALLAQLQADVFECHAAIAARLDRLGDRDSAALLSGIASGERAEAGSAEHKAAFSGPPKESPAHLLRRASEPLERLADACEGVVADGVSEELVDAAQAVLAETVARLAQINRRSEQLQHS